MTGERRRHDATDGLAAAYLVGLRPGGAARELRAAGVRVGREWAELGAAQVFADGRALARLRAHPAVAYVEEDRLAASCGASGQATPYADGGALTWGLCAVHAPEAWRVTRGAGIRICVLDSGVDEGHPALVRADGTGVVKGGRNFVRDGRSDAGDSSGHGTRVAGVIAAQLQGAGDPDDPGRGGMVGVAPDAELYVARVADERGQAWTSAIVAAINWCAGTVGAHLANLSLGHALPSLTEWRAFAAAHERGMLAIAAAGNSGRGPIAYPAAYRAVVAVGAVDQDLAVPAFSRFGRGVELVGPGGAIYAPVRAGTGWVSAVAVDGVPYRSAPVANSGGTDAAGVSGPVVYCGLAAGPPEPVAAPGGWIALFDRGGGVGFDAKVANVMGRGARAAIVANDAAHPDDVGTGLYLNAGNWIPTVSVSHRGGRSIQRAIRAAAATGDYATGTVTSVAGDYGYGEGTSEAAPHVTGVAALAWSANPRLTNVQVRSVLQGTATELPAGGAGGSGCRLVRADRAVELARLVR